MARWLSSRPRTERVGRSRGLRWELQGVEEDGGRAKHRASSQGSARQDGALCRAGG